MLLGEGTAVTQGGWKSNFGLPMLLNAVWSVPYLVSAFAIGISMANSVTTQEVDVAKLLHEYEQVKSTQRLRIENKLRELNPPKRLLEQKFVESHGAVKRLCARLLGRFGDKTSVATLRQGAASKDAGLRADVLNAIVALDAPAGLSFARGLLKDAVPSVRVTALMILSDSELQSDWELTLPMTSDSVAEVRAVAIEFIRYPIIGEDQKRLGTIWMRAIKDPSKLVRMALCRRLGRESDEICLGMLQLIAVKDQCEQVRSQAVGALDAWYRKNLGR